MSLSTQTVLGLCDSVNPLSVHLTRRHLLGSNIQEYCWLPFLGAVSVLTQPAVGYSIL